jgi:hypothetical protein
MRNDRAPARRHPGLCSAYTFNTSLECLGCAFCGLCETVDACAEGSDGVEVDLHALLPYCGSANEDGERGEAGETYGFDPSDFLSVFEEFPAESLRIDSLAQFPFPRECLSVEKSAVYQGTARKGLTRHSRSNSRVADASFRYPRIACHRGHQPSMLDPAAVEARGLIPMVRAAGAAEIGRTETD